MAKRFTDTDLFKKKFIRGLQGAYKLLWIYIFHDCNHAGIWEADFEVASIRVGFDIKESDAVKFFKGKIQIIDNGEKWFIPSFIEFQYGELKESNRAHNSVIQILKKYGIKDHSSPLQGSMDKDKELDKVKDKDIPTEIEFIEYGEKLCKEAGLNFDGLHFSLRAKYDTWVEAKWKDGHGNLIKGWKNKLRNTLPHLKEIKKNSNRYQKVDTDFSKPLE